MKNHTDWFVQKDNQKKTMDVITYPCLDLRQGSSG